MTKPEFLKAMVRLSDAYHDGFNPPDETLAAWYDALNLIPLDVFTIALEFIVETETRWFNANLIALVRKHETGARQRAESLRETSRINDPARMIMESRPTPAEVKILFDKLYAALGEPQIVKGIP